MDAMVSRAATLRCAGRRVCCLQRAERPRRGHVGPTYVQPIPRATGMIPRSEIDQPPGLKIFNTRAAKATDKIAGKGYSAIDDEALKVLPPPPPGAVFDAEEQAKYRAFKEARRGAADYMAMEGEFARYLEDVYSAPPVEREALTDECEILVVGAGFAGLLLWYKLREAGFDDVRFCEKGGDVGGTWYWNRYPGIACDVESYSYLPLLEEMGYFPTMKFASGFEIFEYCQKMAEKFGFYDHCLFHTDGRADRVGRGSRPLDGVHRPRRRHAGALRDPRQRHPHDPEAGPHRGHGDASRASRSTPRAGTTTSTWRASGSASSAPAPPPCRRSPSWPRSSGSSTSSSARRRRSTCATSARRRRRRSQTWSQRAGLGAGPARPVRQDLGRAHGDPGQRRLPRRQGRRLQGAQAARARAVAGGAGPEAARHELPDHGADPRAGRRHRRGPEDGRGAQAVLPVRLQAADVPRRVPADVQPAARPPRRHRADRRRARSTSAASCTTASSTRSTC